MITVGTFDGVHRGHVAVLDAVRRAAQRRGAKSIVVTFEPHPLRVVRPEKAPRLLTTAEEKHEQLERVGLDVIVHLPFTQALAQFTAREFVQEILVDRLRLEHLVIGHDHGLGRDRSGNETALREIGAELGYDVEVVEAVIVEGGPVSSTRIRGLLERGDVVEAATLLGRPYSIRGVVVEGERRGRELGFPTANLQVRDPEKLLPHEGIYATRVRTEAGQHLLGALHLGPRPTFEGASPTIEVHLLDFDGDLYGQELEVEFCDWIREIRPFRDVASLIEAMNEDCARVRALFSAGRGACQSVGSRLD